MEKHQNENIAIGGKAAETTYPQNVQKMIAEKLHIAAEEFSEKTQSPNLPPMVNSYGREISGYLDKSAEYIRDLDLQQINANVQQYVRDNPGFSLLVAAASGLLIGFMVRRR